MTTPWGDCVMVPFQNTFCLDQHFLAIFAMQDDNPVIVIELGTSLVTAAVVLVLRMSAKFCFQAVRQWAIFVRDWLTYTPCWHEVS